jgi:hypothetical protein
MNYNNRVIFSIDIQPAYEQYIGREMIRNFINFLNKNYSTNKIVLFYNGDSMGFETESEYIHWLYEKGADEECLESIKFYDKGYAFFRDCMDSNIDHSDIIALVRFMYKNTINDARDLNKSKWNQFKKENDLTSEEIIDFLSTERGYIHIPELMDFINDMSVNNVILFGGGRKECLKEVQIALDALNINYEKLEQLIYEKQIMKKISLNEFIEREVKSILKEEVIKSKKKESISKKINHLFENSDSSQLDKLEKLIEIYFKKEELNEGWKSALAGTALAASSLLGMNNQANAQSYGGFNQSSVAPSISKNSDTTFITKDKIENGFPNYEPNNEGDTVYSKNNPTHRWVSKRNKDGYLDWYIQKLQKSNIPLKYKSNSMGQSEPIEINGFIIKDGSYHKWVQVSQDRNKMRVIAKNKTNSEQKPKYTKLSSKLDICDKNKSTCHSYD